MNRKKLYAAIIFSVIGFLAGLVLAIIHPTKDLDTKIKLLENTIEEECKEIGQTFEITLESGEKTNLTMLGLSWERIEEITENLTYTNERIAKAKILTYHKENPIPEYSFSGDLWTKRYIISKEPWETETLFLRILKVLGIAIVSGIVFFIVLLMLLFSIPAIWYFLMARLKEISLAIQGKEIK